MQFYNLSSALYLLLIKLKHKLLLKRK